MNSLASIRSRSRVVAVALALAFVPVVDCASARPLSFGPIETFAKVPAEPGFPEGIAVHGNRVFVSGPARLGTAGTGPSAIQVYDRKRGTLVTTISVAGEALDVEHVVSNIAVDGHGRIYALSTQLGLIRFTKRGGAYVQEPYGAPLPDLPPCADPPDRPCSPTVPDLPPTPNDIVFDEAGFAYVTDSLQATVFRYGPGGGAPQIWFQSPLFEGGGQLPFGPNGIRLDPTRLYVYVVVSTSRTDSGLGTIYRLPHVDAPTPADLEAVHHYVGEVPDQLAFSAAGNLYVSLVRSSQVSVLTPDGDVLGRIRSAAGRPPRRPRQPGV